MSQLTNEQKAKRKIAIIKAHQRYLEAIEADDSTNAHTIEDNLPGLYAYAIIKELGLNRRVFSYAD